MTRQILEDEPQPAKIPGWALTYIDLLWLLLLFFILRSAVSEIGEGRRYREITSALKRRFGVEAAATTGGSKESKAAAETIAKDRKQYSEVLREGFDKTAAAQPRSLTLRGAVYFAENDVKLQSEQKQILQAVAERIGREADAIEIRGEAYETREKAAETDRTDRAATDSAYARCVAARDYLVKLGVAPGRLRIAVDGGRPPPGARPRVQLYSVTEMVAEKPGKSPTKR
jgi:outer membrane protein OmpA-like peptidoglycan-associated protein